MVILAAQDTTPRSNSSACISNAVPSPARGSPSSLTFVHVSFLELSFFYVLNCLLYVFKLFIRFFFLQPGLAASNGSEATAQQSYLQNTLSCTNKWQILNAKKQEQYLKTLSLQAERDKRSEQ